MGTGQCRRLLAVYLAAQQRPVRVIVLGGPRGFFSNGIRLKVIEATDDPAEESWRNINAIDDLVEAILTTTDRLTVAALAGNAAAGGLMLALAADQVWCGCGPQSPLSPGGPARFGVLDLHPASPGRRSRGSAAQAGLPAGERRICTAIRPGRPGDHGRSSRLSRAGGLARVADAWL
jgi:hypothetical protein